MVQLPVLATILIPYASALRNDRPPVDPDKPAIWEEAALNGTRYWQAWQQASRRLHDTPPSRYMEDMFITTLDDAKELPCVMLDTLREQGASTDPDDYYESSEYSWLRDFHVAQTAHFSSLIDTTRGTFILTEADKGEGFPKDVHLAEIVWSQWCSACKDTWWKATRSDENQETLYPSLATYWIPDVRDRVTRDILNWALRNKDDGVTTWAPQALSQIAAMDLREKPFWAILGTQHGRPIMRLLTDHFIAMDGQTVCGIHVNVTRGPEVDDEIYNMWFEIGRYDEGDYY